MWYFAEKTMWAFSNWLALLIIELGIKTNTQFSKEPISITRIPEPSTELLTVTLNKHVNYMIVELLVIDDESVFKESNHT